jgi:uncharacterized membrane protein YgcG
MILLFAGILTPAPTLADKDAHIAATVSEKKSAVPLKRVIRKIRKTYGGRLLEIKLEKERVGGKFILLYEAKVLMSNGAVLKLYYHARNLKLLKRKGRYKKRKKKSFWSRIFSGVRNNDNDGSGISSGDDSGGSSGGGNSSGEGDDSHDDNDEGGDDHD